MTTVLDGTILLIDDDHAMRHVIAHSFRALGYFVYEYASAEAAIAFLRSHIGRIDLLVADVSFDSLGDCDAMEAIERLRPGTPVVRLSSWVTRVTPFEFVGDNECFLAKPFRLEQLGRFARAMIRVS